MSIRKNLLVAAVSLSIGVIMGRFVLPPEPCGDQPPEVIVRWSVGPPNGELAWCYI